MIEPGTPAQSPSHAANAKDAVGVAVVGLGFMGVTHLRAYLQEPRSRIAAVCSPRKTPVNGRLEAVAGNIKTAGAVDLGTQVRIYRQFEALLEDEAVDLVDLCTPTSLHKDQAIAALKAGKHVLCEKPLARTSSEAREVLSVAATAPGFLMPAMCMRFWPGWSLLKRVVTERTHGAVRAARFRRVSERPAWSQWDTCNSTRNDPGGALFDLHIHDVDFVHHLLGRPASLTASGVFDPAGSISHVVTQYDYPDGPTVQAEGSWLLAGGFNMAYTLYCERATLDFDSCRGAQALQITEPGRAPRVLPLEPSDGYLGEVRYIIDCVARRQAPERVTARDALVALELCEAEEQSIRSRQRVPGPHRQTPGSHPPTS